MLVRVGPGGEKRRDGRPAATLLMERGSLRVMRGCLSPGVRVAVGDWCPFLQIVALGCLASPKPGSRDCLPDDDVPKVIADVSAQDVAWTVKPIDKHPPA